MLVDGTTGPTALHAVADDDADPHGTATE